MLWQLLLLSKAFPFFTKKVIFPFGRLDEIIKEIFYGLSVCLFLSFSFFLSLSLSHSLSPYWTITRTHTSYIVNTYPPQQQYHRHTLHSTHSISLSHLIYLFSTKGSTKILLKHFLSLRSNKRFCHKVIRGQYYKKISQSFRVGIFIVKKVLYMRHLTLWLTFCCNSEMWLFSNKNFQSHWFNCAILSIWHSKWFSRFVEGWLDKKCLKNLFFS